MSRPERVAVIGLGLIGGSLARDLHARGVTVFGWDRNPDALHRAAREGIVQPMSETMNEVAAAEIVVLAAPVPAIRQTMPLIAALPGTAVVTDVGSVKGVIHESAVAAGLGARYIGSHPLTGDVTSGWGMSRAGMFGGCRVFVTSASPGAIGSTAMRAVLNLWKSLGAIPEVVGPDEHDQMIAWVSHAPQVISTALGVALARAGLPPSALGPGGRSVTRLAASSPELWSGILQANAVHAAEATRAVATVLLEVASALERRNEAVITAALADAQRWAGM